MSADARGVTQEVMTEAAVLASYATENPFIPTLESIEGGLGDKFVSDAIFAVAEHVCGLRARQLPASDAGEPGSLSTSTP